MPHHPLYLVTSQDAAAVPVGPAVTGHVPPVPSASPRRVDVAAANAALAELRPHPSPAAVFAQLAELCVPVVCDEVHVVVIDSGHPDGAAVLPSPRSEPGQRPRSRRAGPDPARFAVTVRITEGPSQGWPVTDQAPEEMADFVVLMTCSWWLRQPTADDVAVVEMLGRGAAAVVTHSRQGVALDEARRRVENLNVALETNRAISAAVGILMARRNVTYEQAIEILRVASQQANLKLGALAAEVLYTGDLPT